MRATFVVLGMGNERDLDLERRRHAEAQRNAAPPQPIPGRRGTLGRRAPIYGPPTAQELADPPEHYGPAEPQTQQLFAEVNLGLRPNHAYGLASPTFGAGMQFDEANQLLQRYNAPTREALYGEGNDPAAQRGVVSRPGARDLPAPADWGGNVTLEHGAGYARNTTIPFQHPLEGTITRNLLVDLNEGGGYQALTLGRGQGGAQLATIAGGLAGQNASHLVNPELGRNAFSQLDRSLVSAAHGTPNPNLQAPSGLGTEAAGVARAGMAGLGTATGAVGPEPSGSPQQRLAYDLARQLNSGGSVDGFFVQSSVLPGVYHITSSGSTYYERGPDGRPVQRPVDEMAGLEQGIERASRHAQGASGATPTELPPIPHNE